MSAALQLSAVWEGPGTGALWTEVDEAKRADLQLEPDFESDLGDEESGPSISLAFYRKHAERMLRRYLYASMQVGRAPSILGESVGRGWVSSRPVRTFEDAVIFVLDIENCLNKLEPLDRRMLSHIVLQEYTQAETAAMLGISIRAISYKFQQALDHLTEKLLDAKLLEIPH